MISIFRFTVVITATLLCSCTSLPENENARDGNPAEITNAELSKTAMYQFFSDLSQDHPNESGFLAFDNGLDALAARINLIERSQATLDVQYYIWHNDLVGRVLYHQLLLAADRGVRVRVLLDDLDTAGKDGILAQLDHHPNIQIRLYNPFVRRQWRWVDFMVSPSRINHRMHNKSITGDGIASILGGRNIGDEYFNATEDVAFNDMDVLAVGQVAAAVTVSFEEYWNSQWAYNFAQIAEPEPVSESDYQAFRQNLAEHYLAAKSSRYGDAIKERWQKLFLTEQKRQLVWGRWELFYDHPDKTEYGKKRQDYLIAPRLMQELDAAQRDIVIVSPYFVPGKKFTRYLIEKVASGVRVRVLTNSLAANDVGMVHAGYRRYREDLLKGGVELYEFKATPTQLGENYKKSWPGASQASLHGKFLGIDEHTIFVGSFNMDARSVSINTELGVLFESSQYGQKLANSFDRAALEFGYRVSLDNDGDLLWTTQEDGRTVQFDHEPMTSWWRRAKNKLMSLIVPESQL